MSHDVHAHRDVLEAAGPAFIKWGQWAATRHDLFPPDFCAILEHLHTQVSVELGSWCTTIAFITMLLCQVCPCQANSCSRPTSARVWSTSTPKLVPKI